MQWRRWLIGLTEARRASETPAWRVTLVIYVVAIVLAAVFDAIR